mgnify:CR=1 FL=1
MGKKNIPIQDVDETDSNLLQYPHKSKKQAALETAGVTASSILSDEVPAVKPADEREGIMEENLITTADAAEIISEILGAKKVSSRVKTSDNVTAGGEMQADIPPSSEEYAAMSNEDFAKLPPPSIVGKEIFGIVSITRSDVDKIAALSSDEKLALKIKINQLDLRKVLPPDRKDGFCCPICGNGSGKDGDGIVPTLTTDEQGNLVNIYYYVVETEVTGVDAASVTVNYSNQLATAGVVRYIDSTTIENRPSLPETGSLIVEKIKSRKSSTFGYDAAKDEYADMMERGIADPTKVTRSALQNAASVAAMVLTTESLVTDIPAPEPAAPAGNPGMGGMY